MQIFMKQVEAIENLIYYSFTYQCKFLEFVHSIKLQMPTRKDTLVNTATRLWMGDFSSIHSI
jgi:hypothetical protein